MRWRELRLPSEQLLSTSPACQVVGPFGVIFDVAAKDILGRAGRLFRHMQQLHAGFIQGAPAFAVVAGRAGSDDIEPQVFPAKMARKDMVDRQGRGAFSAILADEVVAPEDFAAGEFQARPGPVDHFLQADDGGNRQTGRNRFDIATSVHHQNRFIGH